MTSETLFSSQSFEHETPKWLFDKLNELFLFEVDVCSTHENAKCQKHYTIEDNGLDCDWGKVAWCNPPYGKNISEWVKKACEHSKDGGVVVMLLPSRTDTIWFQKYVYNHSFVCFIKGRLKFGGVKKDAPFPSTIAVYSNKLTTQQYDYLASIGTIKNI
jgi:site-specific DNA-methyltransferase (adenine-specific)